MLERLLDVPDGARFSDLERWRKGPAEPSGRNLERSLTRVSEITAVGVGAMELDTVVPHRRLVDLARYGMAAKAPQLRRHPPTRRRATLAATVAYLEAKSIDDCLELFDLLMMTELLGKAEREAQKRRSASILGWRGRRPSWPQRWRSCWRPRAGTSRSGSRTCGR
jgi:hypothetical protein